MKNTAPFVFAPLGWRALALVAGLLAGAGADARAQAPNRSVGAVGEVRSARPAPREAPPPVEIRTRASRTAVWVGDRVTFTVDVTCAPGVDILTDDLAKERLKLTGLELVSATSRRTALDSGGVAYRFDYELATYEVESESVQIDHLPVRYYMRRPGLRLQDAAPAGETSARGAQIARRSTIPDSLPRFGIRDERTPADLPRALGWARPAGAGLALVSAAPVALLVLSLAWRYRPRRARRPRHATPLTQRTLDDLRTLDFSQAAQRREAYGRLDAALRRHLAGLTGMPVESLTAAELIPRLNGHARGVPVDALAALLGDCERARYAPPAGVPTSDQLEEALASTAQLLPSRGLKRFMPSISFRR
ncbi:MAG: hypothetical protein HYU53_02665 [Acidobacteria bacterium]|nr:hypothetical protein [Acidobacteriota bacterium]